MLMLMVEESIAISEKRELYKLNEFVFVCLFIVSS